MGVPSFFRWLSRKYPKIISPVLEDTPQIVDGVALPIDYAGVNPNGELENLYLDMNGIVHPCSHPENRPPPETEDEMLLAVFEYTNRVLNMARPRKVLVIAVDGVAPRAKMNQQRARRFRSARDAEIQNDERERVLLEREDMGEIIDESIRNKKTWDSNAITPGTPFMDKLAAALRYWTSFKLATDPGWKNLQVIISDATVPGEGEHKIMNFIRSQRSDPQYNPNTSHCIYGLDADLIFLGLATHEPHFKILREDVFAQDNRRRQRVQDAINMTEEEKQSLALQESEKPFLWLHVGVLREYLSVELFVPRLSFEFDTERAIDDWVFMCFFCGNDFLPHLPSLDVRENSIDILVEIWKTILPRLKTYMTCDGVLNLESVELLLEQLGNREPEMFKGRYLQEIRKQEAVKRRKMLKSNNNVTQGRTDRNFTVPLENMPVYDVSGKAADGSLNLSNKDFVKLRKEMNLANEGDKQSSAALKIQSEQNKGPEKEYSSEEVSSAVEVANKANFSAAAMMKQKLMSRPEREENQDVDETKAEIEDDSSIADSVTSNKRKIGDIDNETSETPSVAGEDSETPTSFQVIHTGLVKSGVIDTDEEVKLFEPGYHDRYYTAKFHINERDIDSLRKDVVKCYVEGVSWVLLYYYQGCASWDWYYPYHYAPFASDFKNINTLKIGFEKGEPFLPFEQLMSVLPAASGHNLPEIFRSLMKEPNSEIIDFYPQEFPVDMNGKKMSWQGIALLPFIDEKRLLRVVRQQYEHLSESEKSRNVRKQEVLLISNKNANYDKFSSKLYGGSPVEVVTFQHFKSGLAGQAWVDKEGFALNSKMTSPVIGGGLPDISTNLFLKVGYKMPELPGPSKSVLLNGFIPPQAMLTPQDRDAITYRYNHRWNATDMKHNIVPVGPCTTTQYQPRAGGYKSFLFYQQSHSAPYVGTSNVNSFQQRNQGSRYDSAGGGQYRPHNKLQGPSQNGGSVNKPRFSRYSGSAPPQAKPRGEWRR
ncbi:LANO_0H23288g1_1 [Lachancea nothofagi CBS 11611]|uniref:5'-3' exoribonuclease n=1 Tax=Lachancea nothofagi CBS 11611 TaxID=1266666 RepID=A0A1G4KNL3_9SACH|nr:LANO_0H23288g1_1 [Lachancea nothofagi CBS 11611]